MSAGERVQRNNPRPWEEIRAALKADRSPRTVRALLPVEDRALFDREFWHELDRAKQTLDLTPVNECVTRWWWTAYMKADPEEYAATIAAGERAEQYFHEQDGVPAGVSVWDGTDPEVMARIMRGA